MKKIKAIFLIACLVSFLLCNAVAEGYRYEGEGWSTPEEAVQAYVEALKAGDLRKMISTFAIETYVEHYDFRAFLERIKAYPASPDIPYPGTNDFQRAMNAESRRRSILYVINNQMLLLCHPDYQVGMPIAFAGSNAMDMDVFIDAMGQVGPPEDIKWKGFVNVALLNDKYMSPKNQEYIMKQKATYGADELQSMAAALQIEGKPYLLCCDVLKYGDRWFLSSLGGNIGMLMGASMAQGGLIPAQ